MYYDLPDLRLVAAIADSGSLTRAAAQVHLAPSSASHRLTQLEAALGVPLFARHARGLTATAAGESRLRHARQVFAQLEQMHADLAPYASGVASQVTVFANTNAINCSCRKTSATSCATTRRFASASRSSRARRSSRRWRRGRWISASSPPRAGRAVSKRGPTGRTA